MIRVSWRTTKKNNGIIWSISNFEKTNAKIAKIEPRRIFVQSPHPPMGEPGQRHQNGADNIEMGLFGDDSEGMYIYIFLYFN